LIEATHRLVPVVVLSSAFLVIGVLRESSLLVLGLSLFSMIVALRGYAVLECNALSRLKTTWSVKHGFEGENIVTEVLIENKTWIPIITAELVVNYSPHLKLVRGSRAGIIIIPPKTSVSYKLVFRGRVGHHYIGPLKVIVRDPLGLYKSAELLLAEQIFVEIKPRASETVIRKLMVHTRSTGLSKVKTPGVGVEFYDTRDYVPGDELRSIDWKKYAYTGKLVVKEYEKETYQVVLFLVDATPYMTSGPFGETPFEHTARVVSSMVLYLAKRGDLVGLILYDHRKVVSTGKLYRGRRAYHEVLRALSKTEYSLGEYNEQQRGIMLRTAFNELLKMLPREKNMIFIFTSSWKSNMETLVEIVKKLSYMNSLVYVVVPIIAAYEVKGVNPWSRAIYRLKTLERLREDLEFASKLRRLGARAIAVGPELIPQVVVSIIESMS
jgi:uncharacterized protein (DUF58 family)